jgi:hypothetical protein
MDILCGILITIGVGLSAVLITYIGGLIQKHCKIFKVEDGK